MKLGHEMKSYHTSFTAWRNWKFLIWDIISRQKICTPKSKTTEKSFQKTNQKSSKSEEFEGRRGLRIPLARLPMSENRPGPLTIVEVTEREKERRRWKCCIWNHWPTDFQLLIIIIIICSLTLQMMRLSV